MKESSNKIRVQVIEMLLSVPDEDVNEILIEAFTTVQDSRKKRIETFQRDKCDNETRLNQLSAAMRGENKAVKMDSTERLGLVNSPQSGSRNSYDHPQ
jgi:hypothetical protein